MKNLQNLKRNNDFKADLKYKICLFFFQLPIHLLIIGSVFFVAIVLNKYIEAVAFLISFFSLRYKFDKTYHHEKLYWCIPITITMFTLSVCLIKPLYISLFSSILFAFADATLLWYIRYAKDIKEELKEFKDKTIWNMTEEELRRYCKIVGIYNERQDFVVLVLKGEKFYDISNKLGYSVDTLKDWSAICKKKLKIKSWQQDKN